MSGGWGGRVLRLGALAAGLGVVAVLLRQGGGLGDVGAHLARVGPAGFALLTALTVGVFLVDAVTWQLALPARPLDLRWLGRLWRVRLAGEALNSVTPAAGLGGEPVKAALLRARYGVGLRDAAVSIVVGRTVNMVALVPVAAIGVGVMLQSAAWPRAAGWGAAVGLLAYAVMTGVVLGLQCLGLASRLDGRLGGRVGALLGRTVAAAGDVEVRFRRLYTAHRGRLGLALALAAGQWVLGALDVWVTLRLLGHPVALAEAVAVESVVQLVRAGTFFVPAGLGTQDGALAAMTTALTGSPSVGLAAAALRRLRDVLMIGWGLVEGGALGWGPVRRLHAGEAAPDR
jgi:uncharacterized protein (TIRG00374 family)